MPLLQTFSTVNIFLVNKRLQICGAGIMLLDSHRKSLLLGKERNSRYLWSDFGGKVESYDLNSWATATREFIEETNNCFNLNTILSDTNKMYIFKTFVPNLKDVYKIYICYVLEGEFMKYMNIEKFNSQNIHQTRCEKSYLKWFKIWKCPISTSYRIKDFSELALRFCFQRTL